jgi:branched-chain amino acid transport system ATP-binding protein
MFDNSSSFITPNSSLLEISDLHAGYGPTEVLKGVSFTVNEGEIVTVLGANGAGKSTTLMTICGVNHCRRGRIMFDGAQIQNTPPHEIVRRGISQVPEGRHIFHRLTVRENLEMGAFQRHDGHGINADLERVFSSFPILKERQNQLGGTLSGGEQQMLAISRALMARPRLLLLDEPSLGLAPMIVTKIFDIIRGINQQGTTILLVEQNANMALHVAHRGYVLETGRIVLHDTAQNLMNNEQVKKSYLGG